jgi:hypothetical protein
LPYLFPTPDGGVRAEWSSNGNEISLDIQPDARNAVWHRLNLAADADDERSLNLTQEESWSWITAQLQTNGGDEK